MTYTFHFYNSLAETGLLMALSRFIKQGTEPPVIVCIGSDLAVGDSLGPVTGTMLKRKMKFNQTYVYGTLKNPITAKEVKYLNKFLSETHPNSKIIAIDAAVGDDSEVGLISVSDAPLKPGAGAKKRLGKIGDVSILGIVARKSAFSYTSLNLTRFNMIYCMSEIISEALSALLCKNKENS